MTKPQKTTFLLSAFFVFASSIYANMSDQDFSEPKEMNILAEEEMHAELQGNPNEEKKMVAEEDIDQPELMEEPLLIS